VDLVGVVVAVQDSAYLPGVQPGLAAGALQDLRVGHVVPFGAVRVRQQLQNVAGAEYSSMQVVEVMRFLVLPLGARTA
jgi:hypothetical protein